MDSKSDYSIKMKTVGVALCFVLFCPVIYAIDTNSTINVTLACPPPPATLFANGSDIFLHRLFNDSLIFREGQHPIFNFSLLLAPNSSRVEILKVTIDSSDSYVLVVSDQQEMEANISQTLNQHLQFSSRQLDDCGHVSFPIDFVTEALQLGKSLVTMRMHYSSEGNETVQVADLSFTVIVLRMPRMVELIFRVVITIVVIFLTFCMGADLDMTIIWNYLKKPIAPAIGFSSQFLLMPLIAFGLSMTLPIPTAMGFGLLIVGCSPGGGASNIWTILLGGELNLSMTMTFLSSIAALGMMPMWIYLLGGFFIDTKRVAIPYVEITIQLLFVVVPVFLGIALRYKFLHSAQKVARLTRPIALFFIIFVMTFGTYVQWYIFKLFYQNPLLLFVGGLLPWLGFFGGALVAFLLRQQRPQIITIALETGIQNIGIAILVLKYSMPQPDGELGAAMPLAVALFTPLPLYVALIVMKIKKRFFDPPNNGQVVEVHSNNMEAVSNASVDEYDKRVYNSKVHKSRTPKNDPKNRKHLGAMETSRV